MLGVASALVSPLAGELVYNGTHGDTCYYVNCSLDCTLEFFNWSCPSTPSPTPSPSTPTTHEPRTSSTPPPGVRGCPDLDPPRQVCVCGGFCPLWHLNPHMLPSCRSCPASAPHQPSQAKASGSLLGAGCAGAVPPSPPGWLPSWTGSPLAFSLLGTASPARPSPPVWARLVAPTPCPSRPRRRTRAGGCATAPGPRASTTTPWSS